ncbi:MAG: hypothetical protein Q7U98_20110 [Methylicorpusculum sp.]|uniref:hypothetical protein n=1 Tax=Methylicorpusculum sp. TaxID=2713644 RepID=UPI0027241DBC|nr:hypothetical protein [Methylicorpusculum sp.]MDO8941469.1 hypothetical protein [Methylicorpusculum sp.]
MLSVKPQNKHPDSIKNIKSKSPYLAIVLIPVIIISAYTVSMLFFTETNWKSNPGTFGDSFGIINALFTGLAFSGLIVTIMLQYEAIKIQQQDFLESRHQFARSADAQERTARLVAASELLKEYNEYIKIIETEITDDENRKCDNTSAMGVLSQSVKESSIYKHPKFDRLKELKQKKHDIIEELEELMLKFRKN